MKKYKLPLGKIFLSFLLTAGLTVNLAGTTLASQEAAETTEGTQEQTQESIPDEASVEEPQHTLYYDQIPESNQWENWPQGPLIEAQAGILMDYNTGAVIYSKNADERLYPASITKIMTALLACENTRMDDTVVTSENAVYGISEDSSKAYLEVGEEMTMTQMLMCVMLQSANDAAYAVAEHTSGSMKKFVELMNRRAKQIGCTNTHFNNPHGLHSDNHYTTARDMALIMKTAWRNARFRSFASRVTYDIPPTNKNKETRYYLNNHKMMKTEVYEYEGVMGGKTGFTDLAGNTLVTVAKQGRVTLVSVILNGVNGAYGDTATLLDYGFGNFNDYGVNTTVVNAVTRTLPCDENLLPDEKWPSILEPAASYYVTLPNGVKIADLRRENTLLPNSPGINRIKTSFYYGEQLTGTCFSYEKEVLKDLFD